MEGIFIIPILFMMNLWLKEVKELSPSSKLDTQTRVHSPATCSFLKATIKLQTTRIGKPLKVLE